MTHPAAGPLLVLAFTLGAALRDVHFAGALRAVPFPWLALFAFGGGSLVFFAAALVRAPGDLARLVRLWREALAVFALTATAWTAYFLSLERTDPAVVATLFAGVQPLVVVAFDAAGLRLVRPDPIGRSEAACLGAVAVALLALVQVSLAGGGAEALAGAAFAALSGSCIAVSVLFSKRLHDRGIGSDAVMATRFLGVAALAAALLAVGPSGAAPAAPDLLALAPAAVLLIVLPSWAFQLGLARTSPLTAAVITALGPALVFVLQAADGRFPATGEALACILAYTAAVLAANLARHRRKLAPA